MSGKSNIVTPQMAQSINSNVSKAVIGYVTRVENTDEGLKRTWELVHGQPPNLRQRRDMFVSAIMLNSKEANHLVNPAQILIDAGKDAKQGHYLSAGLGVLAVLPGLEEIKFLKFAGSWGKCSEFAAEYFSKFNKTITKAGGTIEKFEIAVPGSMRGMSTLQSGVSETGFHAFLEITTDGKTFIVDNMHPLGIPKEEYVKSLQALKMDNTVVEGAEIFQKYVKKAKK